MELARKSRFRKIFAEHVHEVWRALRYLGVAESDIADVSQEVFVTVFRRLGDFEGDEGSLRAWIRGIAVRTAANHRRTRRRRREIGPDALPEAATEAPQLEDVRRRRLRETLLRGLDTLDESKRQVFVLFELDGLPMKQVAELVGCPPQTAYARLYAARRALAAFLRREQGRRGHAKR